MISIEEHIAAMQNRWPHFILKAHGQRDALWEGILAPDRREHQVRIRYRVPLVVENFTIHAIQPRVQVLAPLLEWHPEYDQGPIPHVYRCREKEELPYLCLFSPAGREWTPDDLLARTTVFWASEWLHFYEGWLITRKWQGGGKHQARPTQGGKQFEAV